MQMDARQDTSRTAAAKIVDLILRQAAEQDRLLAELQRECPEEEFRRYRQMIGRSMGSLLDDVMKPIFQTYPDLTPPQLREPPPDTSG
jgi:hypothetical protein